MKKKETKLLIEPSEPNDKYWSLTIGFYPGILFGFRTYEEAQSNIHVL